MISGPFGDAIGKERWAFMQWERARERQSESLVIEINYMAAIRLTWHEQVRMQTDALISGGLILCLPMAAN